jgi:hypothetical protein
MRHQELAQAESIYVRSLNQNIVETIIDLGKWTAVYIFTNEWCIFNDNISEALINKLGFIFFKKMSLLSYFGKVSAKFLFI